MTKREIFILIGAGAVFVGIVIFMQRCSLDSIKSLKESLDTLHRDGNKTYTKSLTDKDLAKHEAALKDYIDRKTMTATNIVTWTKVDTTGKPIIIHTPDVEPHVITLPDGTREVRLYPTYRKSFDNPWYHADVSADCSAVNLKLSIKDSLTVRHKVKNTGFLGLGKQYIDVEVFNHNPHSTTTGLKSFYQPVRRRRFGIGVGVYGGIGTDLKPHIFIGGGIQYNLIQF